MLAVKRQAAKVALLFTVLIFGFGFKGCYQPVSETGLPKRLKTIAVPAFQFEARALRYKLESRFTDAVTREIIKRNNGLIVKGTREGADASIDGTVKNFSFSGVLLDRESRARVYEVTITAAVTVRDLQQNRIVYDNQNIIFRDSFEFTDDPRTFFNEEDPAVERIARAFAESIISTIINSEGVKREK